MRSLVVCDKSIIMPKIGKILELTLISVLLHFKLDKILTKNTENIGFFKIKKEIVNVLLFSVLSSFLMSQESYNNCAQALEICPNQAFSVNNILANKTLCSNCDDNFNFCFAPINSIWLKFTSNNSGGNCQIDFSNLIFETGTGQDNEIQATIIKAQAPCDGTTYTAIGNCVSNATGNFSLAGNLVANSIYYVVISGSKNAGFTKVAEASMDVSISGPGVDRIIPFLSINAPTTTCKNELVTFTCNIQNCPDSLNYQWFINGELFAQTPGIVFQTTALNNGDVVTVSNTCFIQCPAIVTSSSLPIFVETFLVDAGEDKFISLGESVQLDGFTAALNYSWAPTGLINLSPKVSPSETTTYFLSGTQNGCTITDNVLVTVSLKLEITNSFSPNQDGYNDTWEIPSLEQFPNCLVQIYSRWGQLVFTSTGYGSKKAWDGKINGKLANESTFFYTIDLRDGSDRILKGNVSIIR
jgi:gliding motility-associated-like protein